MYKVLRAFTAYDHDGIKREVKPGDTLSNIGSWPNIEKYYIKKWITDASGKLYDRRYRLTGKYGRAYLKRIEKKYSSNITPLPKLKSDFEPELELIEGEIES